MSNMVVRTNIFALNAHRNMKNVGLDQGRASNRLSSGFRINSAADDAAGLAISENMRAQIRGLDQASRNTQDGQAMLLTTEGGLEEIGNMLQRVRELMVQASNDTNTQQQRALIQQEIAQLGVEIESMQNRVEFNTNRVLAMGPAMTSVAVERAGNMAIAGRAVEIYANTLGEMRRDTLAAIDAVNALSATATVATGAVQDILNHANRSIGEVRPNHGNVPAIPISAPAAGGAGGAGAAGAVHAANAEAVVTVTLPQFHAAAIAGAGYNQGAAGAVALATGAHAASTALQPATWTNNRATTLANLQTRLGQIDTALNTLATIHGGDPIRNAMDSNVSAARSHMNANSTANNIAFFQVGANASQGISFDFETVSRAVSSAGLIVQSLAPTMSAPAGGDGVGNGVRITRFISAVDSSIDDISRVRANLGAVQNRMDYTMRSLDISSENLQDSESRVRNADIAREMMRFTMSNVLQQAAVSMLAQANQMPQNLLQLLR